MPVILAPWGSETGGLWLKAILDKKLMRFLSQKKAGMVAYICGSSDFEVDRSIVV
jgi:hypothetical protein